MGFGVGAFLLSKVLAPLLVLQAEGDLALVFLWLGVVFACILLPSSFALSDPPTAVAARGRRGRRSAERRPRLCCSLPPIFGVHLHVGGLFLQYRGGHLRYQLSVGTHAGSVGLRRPVLRAAILVEYGATLIAVSSLCNGVGRLFWGLLSDRIGRVRVFRILLASQMIVFGILMTERNPWIFAALVCYVLLCFGGGFATMPSFVLDVFGTKRMSTIYGTILTAWAAAGICGPLYVGHLKDQYPDRAVMYCFLIGIFMLGLGYVFLLFAE